MKEGDDINLIDKEYSEIRDLVLETRDFVSQVEKIHLKQHKKIDLSWMGVTHGSVLIRLYYLGELTMTEIADKIGRTGPTTSVLVKKLKKNGMLASRKSQEDARVNILSLTNKGIDYCVITENYLEKLFKVMEEDLSLEEIKVALKIIKKIGINIDNFDQKI